MSRTCEILLQDKFGALMQKIILWGRPLVIDFNVDLDVFCIESGFSSDELHYHADTFKRTEIPYEGCVDYYEGAFDLLTVTEAWFEGNDLHVVVRDW